MNRVQFKLAMATALAFGAYLVPASADAPCEGAYKSWGRGCDGGAYVRRNSIEWHSTWSVCKATPYDIIDSELHAGNPRRVVYKLRKLSKTCRYPIIEIVEGAGKDDYWTIKGYPSAQAYEKRGDEEWIGAELGRKGAWCPVELEKPQTRCSIDIPKK
jgi:hypothetical protein